MKFDGMTASVGSGSQRLQFAELGPSAANSNLHGHVGLHDGNRRVDWQAVWGSQSVLLGRGTTGIAWSLTLSVVALGVIGVATSLLSGRGLVYSSTRQVVVGALAAGATYAAGALIGVSLSCARSDVGLVRAVTHVGIHFPH